MKKLNSEHLNVSYSGNSWAKTRTRTIISNFQQAIILACFIDIFFHLHPAFPVAFMFFRHYWWHQKESYSNFLQYFHILKNEVSLLNPLFLCRRGGESLHWSFLQIQLYNHHPPDASKAGASRWQWFLVTNFALITSSHLEF